MKSYLDDALEAREVVECTHVPCSSICKHFRLMKLGWTREEMGLRHIFNIQKSVHALITCVH